MTHRYTDMNQADALYKVACKYPGGIEALAGRMDMSTNVLRNKLAPRTVTHHITWAEVSEIVEYLQEAKVEDALLPLRAQNWRHGLVAFAMPALESLSEDQLAMTVCKVMKEAGDVAEAVGDAMADGKITLEEMDRIEREFHEALAALGQWRQRVQERFAKQTPMRVA
ncbi:MAG: hypothetical protein JWR21_915 [Herminiimonas sp.]|nr:hypothetical protein [Herminiimonas sp.]